LEAATEEWNPIHEIHKAARSAHSSNDIIDIEDLEQELWVFYLEHGSIQDYTDAKKSSLLRQQAKKICRQERVDYQHFSGAFHYTPAAVRSILEDCVWMKVEDAYDIEGRVDVSEAMRELTQEQRNLLCLKYGYGEELTGTQKRAAFKAVDRIADILNGRAPAQLHELSDVWGEA
jgi:hypothetical protein